MPKIDGGQRWVLQTILDAQGDNPAPIEDTRVAQVTQISLRNTRDWYLTLDQDGYVDLVLTEGGLRASVTPKGRLALGLYQPFPTRPTPSESGPARSRSRTGRERALVIGISNYPSPIRKLPAVANDVREMATLLGSDKGQFPAQNVLRLTDAEATSEKVMDAIETTFAKVQPDDAVFAYMAGHGEVVGGEYYFVAIIQRSRTSPLTVFRSTRSRRRSIPHRANEPSSGLTSATAAGSSHVISSLNRTTEKSSAGHWRWSRGKVS